MLTSKIQLIDEHNALSNVIEVYYKSIFKKYGRYISSQIDLTRSEQLRRLKQILKFRFLAIKEDLNLIRNVLYKNGLQLLDVHLVSSDCHNYRKPLLITTKGDKQYIYKRGCGAIFKLMANWYLDFVNFKNNDLMLFHDEHGLIRKWLSVDQVIYDPESFYYNFGALISFAHIFNIVDLHCENIIISDQVPIPIDTECMFYPFDNYSMSLLPECTGLIEREGGLSRGLSALSGGGVYSEYVDPISKSGTVYLKKHKHIKDNIPFDCNGRRIKFSPYTSSIIKGAADYYSYALDNKKRIVNDAKDGAIFTRKIFCPTIFYRVMLSESLFLTPKNISKLIKRRLKRYRNFNRDQCLIQQEIYAITRLNIPSFYYSIHTGELMYPKLKNKPLLRMPSIDIFVRKLCHANTKTILDHKKRLLNILKN